MGKTFQGAKMKKEKSIQIESTGDMLPEKNQLELSKEVCLLQPCEMLEDEATGQCYACRIGSSIKKAYDLCQPIVSKALKENKELRKRLNDWVYELAYYTEDEVATPTGVKKFVGNLLKLLEQYKFDIKVERSLKARPKPCEDTECSYCIALQQEIDDLREQLHNKIFKQDLTEEEIKRIILDVSDYGQITNFPSGWRTKLAKALTKAKQAQPNALKASEVKPKPLSKSRIEEILHNEIWTTFEQESRPYGMRAVSIKKAAEAIVTHIAEQERE